MPCSDGCGLCNVNIKNLSVRKGDESLLDNVTFSFKCGEMTALIGTNGAGKTTLLRAILGEIPHEGTVEHEDCSGENIEKIKIGYVPQQLIFDRGLPVSVYDFLAPARTNRPVCFFGINKGTLKKELDDALELVGCKNLAKRRLGELSGGELQRIMLIQALFPMPELLILDEPVSGVDYAATEQFYKIISELRKSRHMAIAIVSHDLELVRRFADKVILLKKQVLTQGTPSEVFATPEFKKEFY